jgi:hypothetical protein
MEPNQSRVDFLEARAHWLPLDHRPAGVCSGRAAGDRKRLMDNKLRKSQTRAFQAEMVVSQCE